MIKNLPLLFSLCLSLSLSSQISLEHKLDSINSVFEANEFIASHKYNKGKIIVFNTEKHKTKLANDIYDLSLGGKKSYKSDSKVVYYKVVDKQIIPHYRMGYILLDKNKLTDQECEQKIALIKDRLDRGHKFFSLASQYSMDNSAYTGGDSGWFIKGTYFEEIEMALESNKFLSGEIMVVDVPSKNFTFVLYNTHNKKLIEEYKVLKLTDFAK